MDEQEIPTPEARERDALFGASARRSAADSPSPMGHDSRTEASLALGGGTGGGWDAPSAATWIGMTRPQQDGQQLGQLSWAEVRKKVDVAERQRGLRLAYESVEVGRETLEHLEDQKAFLDDVNLVLYNQPPSGQSRFYEVIQIRTEGAHRRESAVTGPITVEVARVTGAASSGDPVYPSHTRHRYTCRNKEAV